MIVLTCRLSNFSVPQGNICFDFLAVTFCGPCAILQEGKEIDIREAHKAPQISMMSSMAPPAPIIIQHAAPAPSSGEPLLPPLTYSPCLPAIQ